MLLVRTVPLFIFSFTALFALFVHTASGTSPEPASKILQDLGFTLTYQDVQDFEVKDLEGNKHHLSELKAEKKWVFLVFWATWCGPCVYELPTLQRLREELGTKNLSLIGVSVDQNSLAIKKFVDQKNIKLPIWHDYVGKASEAYQASAVPSLYAISPEWKIVGVFRGASDWGSPSVVENFKKLIKSKLDFKEQKDQLAQNNINDASNASIELPNNLVPPEVLVSSTKRQGTIKDLPLHEGDSFFVEVRVRWKGDSRDYLIKVPRLTLPEGIEEEGDVESSSESTEQDATLAYKFKLRASKEGDYKIGPVELSFSPRAGGKELFARASEISIYVKKDMLARFWFLIFIPILIGFCIWWWVLKCRKESFLKRNICQSQQKWEIWQTEYQEIKAKRFQGNDRDYAITLVSFAKRFWEKLGRETTEWDKILESIKYAGKPLASSEIEHQEKKIERDLFTQE